MRLLSTTACKALLTVIALATMLRDGLTAEIVRVVVWDEQQPAQKQAYDNFLGNCIADHLKTVPGLEVRSVNINDGEQGLSPAILDFAEVLVWWGHIRQAEIKPETGRDILARVKAGRLTLVAVHSAHWATPFMEAMNERAREDVRRSFADVPADMLSIEEVPVAGRKAPPREARLTPASDVRKFPDGRVQVRLHMRSLFLLPWSKKPAMVAARPGKRWNSSSRDRHLASCLLELASDGMAVDCPTSGNLVFETGLAGTMRA